MPRVLLYFYVRLLRVYLPYVGDINFFWSYGLTLPVAAYSSCLVKTESWKYSMSRLYVPLIKSRLVFFPVATL